MARHESEPNKSGEARCELTVDKRKLFLDIASDLRIRVVVDASAVLKDLRWLVTKRRHAGARSALQEALASGLVIGYAPPVLRTSVVKYLPDFAEELGIPIDRLMSEWSAYEPLLQYVEPEPMNPSVFGNVDLTRDPDDLPYLQLAMQLGVDAVLTRDKDIVAMGSDAAIGFGKLRTVAGLPDSVPAAEGLDRLASALPQPWGFSSEFPGAAVSGLAMTIARGSSSAGVVIANVEVYILGSPSEEDLQRITQAEAEWLRRQEQVREQLRDVLSHCPRTVATLALSVLARATGPLSIDEIVTGMRAAGYRTTSPKPHAYISRQLRKDHRVRRYGDGLYGLWGSKLTRPAAGHEP
jgi:hypothetical protein